MTEERIEAAPKSAHTPGPWVVEPIVPSLVRVRDSRGDVVSLMSCDADDVEAIAAIDADAHLIAAAPRLFELLIRLVETHSQHNSGEVFERSVRQIAIDARDAIAEARGGR